MFGVPAPIAGDDLCLNIEILIPKSETIFLCLEQAPAYFNARGWILTTDFTAPSWTLHPKALNEIYSQNRRRLTQSGDRHVVRI